MWLSIDNITYRLTEKLADVGAILDIYTISPNFEYSHWILHPITIVNSILLAVKY